MKNLIKITFLILAVCSVATHAGMIEYTDDDPKQYLIFSADDGVCDTVVIDSLQLWVKIHADSGFIQFSFTLADTVSSLPFNYIAADRDAFGNLIPGHYMGEYWYHTIVFYNNGFGILSLDTVHQAVDYHIIGGCLPTHEVDDAD